MAKWSGNEKDGINWSDDEYCNDQDQYDCYGKTPPRTKLSRKIRERKNKDKDNSGYTPKMAKKQISRRNTITYMFDELITKAENMDSDQGKRADKRSIKLLRGSERDLKLDIDSAQRSSFPNDFSLFSNTRRVESCKRFMSLCSRRVPPVGIKSQLKESVTSESGTNSNSENNVDCPKSRIEFHRMLSMLIRMGCGDKGVTDRSTRRHISREEQLWQTELKDLIWLELQAWHADRTPSEQDEFLCKTRESVACLLNEIMNYKFQKSKQEITVKDCDCENESDCFGCLSMYCKVCMESQNKALREVEELLKRLEAAESLFPSSKAFGDQYALYKSPEFVGRVKSMCLWYNMTKHQRLKLAILGKLLSFLENKYYQWPIQYEINSLDSASPSDSNSSNSSVNDYLYDKDLYNIGPLHSLVVKQIENKASPYRKYIENILKTRGLGKSMSFLDRLHKHVLEKAHFTLQKPSDESIFTQVPNEDPQQELIRYGCWSPEAISLELPSYKAAFLFLSAVPLEVVHEFLRMRLEQKPNKPSPLSVRQLMRELKEGIKIATSQRERVYKYIETVLTGVKDTTHIYKNYFEEFDKNLLLVFKDYLEYLSTWALLQHENFQKNLLEEEWNFICEDLTNIPDAFTVAANKFFSILGEILTGVESRLISRIEELAEEIRCKDDENNKKHNLFAICRELQYLFKDERELSIKVIAFAKTIIRSQVSKNNVAEFKNPVVALKCTIPNAIERVQKICDIGTLENLDETERTSLLSRNREIMMQGFRFGFEFHKEMSEFVPAERKQLLARSMVQFAHLWMKFVQEKCERGRGKRPRWAYQGLDFLLTVCEPQYTKYLSDEEFEELKTNMDMCISHVIGTTAPSTPDSGFISVSPRPSLESARFPRSRGSSPSPRPNYRSQRSSASRKTSVEQNSPSGDVLDSPNFNSLCSKKEDPFQEMMNKLKHVPDLHAERIREAVQKLDEKIDINLREHELIGCVRSKNVASVKHIRRRNVTFSWQRGIKIGQGRFGKVYTAVNNDTGEMMAVKEIVIQHNDDDSIRKITDEIKIMEGISHKHLVKFYGLEVHKEEMLIFMEFCPEGTLESLVAATELGLPELLIRRFTYQLLRAVGVLHDHGIVHRDVKTANIFLTDEGNCLKLGDFGCAVKIKSHLTMPGELQGFFGTQAYMAPEMFMKTIVQGHGRAADIWSVGCVVVEMASGKRPWAEYDSNYQIMFKVGMGDVPEAPSNLIQEGHDFLDMCFQHDPKKRATAFELLNHNFVKIDHDL